MNQAADRFGTIDAMLSSPSINTLRFFFSNTRCNVGDLEHKVNAEHKPDGSEVIREQVRITSQGMKKLAHLLYQGEKGAAA
nr:phage antirepressor KilAC domain-containing protein [Saccharibacter sp. 17.LH.SD]